MALYEKILFPAFLGSAARALVGWSTIKDGEWERINHAYMEKYVDPHSRAKATLVQTGNLYHADVKRIIGWEYGVVTTRTDWIHNEPRTGGQHEG